jgi:hypothetical protein
VRAASGLQARPATAAARPADRVAAGIPALSALAALLAIAGAPPTVMVVVSAVTRHGSAWWLYALLVIPVLEAWGAWWLLTARGWLLLVLSCVPGAILFGYVAWARFAGPVDLRPGWMSLALVCPVLALLLGALPTTRRWVSARREFVGAPVTA